MSKSFDIKVFPKAKRNEIVEEAGLWKVYTTSPAVDGKANQTLIELLSRHLKVRKYQLRIIKGLKSRHKTIMIIF